MNQMDVWGMAGVLWLPLLLIAVESYFWGCFNGAVIVSKYILHDDVRNHGSGNAGLTNFHRTFGGGLTAVVILCDMLKAVIALLIGVAISNFALVPALSPVLAKYWAAVFCLLGHMYPCMFGFKGGKGILSGGTVALMIDWRVALVVWGGFLALVILTRYVSLGSVLAAVAFGACFAILHHDTLITMLCGIFMGSLAVFMHRENIRRLIKGEERKTDLFKK